jgi:hypothetical protein
MVLSRRFLCLYYPRAREEFYAAEDGRSWVA